MVTCLYYVYVATLKDNLCWFNLRLMGDAIFVFYVTRVILCHRERHRCVRASMHACLMCMEYVNRTLKRRFRNDFENVVLEKYSI